MIVGVRLEMAVWLLHKVKCSDVPTNNRVLRPSTALEVTHITDTALKIDTLTQDALSTTGQLRRPFCALTGL